jgi:hypothetical protein
MNARMVSKSCGSRLSRTDDRARRPVGLAGPRGPLGTALVRSVPARMAPTIETPNEPNTRISPGESEMTTRPRSQDQSGFGSSGAPSFGRSLAGRAGVAVVAGVMPNRRKKIGAKVTTMKLRHSWQVTTKAVSMASA